MNYFLIFFILIIQKANSQDLLLTGSLSGFEDGTKIVLNPFLDNMDIDMDKETTLLLKDGKFEFTKHLDKPTKFSLRVRPQNYDKIEEYEQLTFWAENKSMDLTGIKGQVFQSNIRGSSIQEEYYEYILRIAEIENDRKAIFDSVIINPNISAEKKSEMRKRFSAYERDLNNIWNDFIFSNPAYYCTAPELVFYITFFPDKIEIQQLKEYYNRLNAQLKVNVYGKQIKAFLEKQDASTNYPPLEIGDYPYNFELNDTSENRVKFSSIEKRIILLDFWGSGCGPCRREHKNYVQIYRDYKNKGFEIVSISMDQSRKRLINAMIEDKMNWISLWDKNKVVYRDIYHVPVFPTNYLIVDGKILAINLKGEDLRKEIETVLNEIEN